VAGLGRHHRCYRASWCRPTLPYRPFEPLPSLFLLFLQEIISGRPRKPAETLARAKFDDKKTAKTAAAGERTAKSVMPARDRRQQHRINSTANLNAVRYHILRNLASNKCE
jgi:hypothetical protein